MVRLGHSHLDGDPLHHLIGSRVPGVGRHPEHPQGSDASKAQPAVSAHKPRSVVVLRRLAAKGPPLNDLRRRDSG